jgi:serine protease Do
LILSINQSPVTTPAAASEIIAQAKRANRDTVLLLVQRGNAPARYIGIGLKAN